MKIQLLKMTGLALLLVISGNSDVAADEPSAPANVGLAEPLPAPATILILNQAVSVEAVPADDAKEIAEPINLEVLTAPLKALFGIGGPAEAMGVDFAAPIIWGEALDADGAIDQNEALLMQFQQQYRPFLNEELGFVRLVCSDLTPEQRPKVKQAGEAGLKEMAKAMAELQNPQPGVFNLQQKRPADPRSMIRNSINKALEETLTTERFAEYRLEADERLTRRKQGAILSVVSRLEGCLYLKMEQRNAIINSLKSHWEDKWEQWLMMNAYGDQYFPVIPDERIVPHLDENQKSVWQQLQRVDFGIWWGGGAQNNQNDGWWGDVAVEGAQQANPAIMQIRVGF